MTHDLVERMVGHRTRLAQEDRDRLHEGEDQAVARYLDLSARSDRSALWLTTLTSRGWLVLGVAGLAPAFAAGSGGEASLAVALVGILSAYFALRKLTGGLLYLVGAGIAWRDVAPLFAAAAQPEPAGAAALTLATFAGEADAVPVHGGGSARPRSSSAPPPPIHGGGSARPPALPLLEARELVFRYRDRGEPVLRGCCLRVLAGDRLLIEGRSGSGKSTLAALLSGLRRPSSGLLLLRGLDLATLGAGGVRRRVATAPQFHDNHVLTETFAFNLLMGRRWPPREQDLADAEAVCRELGLGGLIDRMPSGMMQRVGESGWQLSHGERSRLYVARALLQSADLVVLDESFAALDPESLGQALRCALARAPALLVIAHP
jgi:ATP-binding cassette subfamily B protein